MDCCPPRSGNLGDACPQDAAGSSDGCGRHGTGTGVLPEGADRDHGNACRRTPPEVLPYQHFVRYQAAKGEPREMLGKMYYWGFVQDRGLVLAPTE